LIKQSFSRTSSERTCETMASCSAVVPLLENSAEAFLSRLCCQSRIASLVAFWASDVALRYACMHASAIRAHLALLSDGRSRKKQSECRGKNLHWSPLANASQAYGDSRIFDSFVVRGTLVRRPAENWRLETRLKDGSRFSRNNV
jgi:hypothetical protein